VGRENENVVIEYEGNYFRIPFDQVRKAKLVFDEGGKEHGKNKSEAIEKALNEYIRQIASDLDLTPQEIIEALKDALVSAIRKNWIFLKRLWDRLSRLKRTGAV